MRISEVNCEDQDRTKSASPDVEDMAVGSVTASPLECQSECQLLRHQIAELAVDIWRITLRAQNDDSSHRVLAACERASDRLRSIGFEVVNPIGQYYDSNMRVRVIDHVGGTEPFKIIDCVSPAIYFKGELIREADIVTQGE